MKAMTKERWVSLKEVLLHVPVKLRNLAWKEAVEFIEEVLANRNNLAPDVDVEKMRFSVVCDICRNPIFLGEDYAFKGVSAKYVHYDCHMRSATDRV